jgi:hypothetical protein
MMLGKREPVVDPRTMRMVDVLRTAVPPPATWTYDKAFPQLAPHPTPMLGNDRMGDCVLVSAAHYQIGYEAVEHGYWPRVVERLVTDLYWRLTGGQDTGLYMLETANYWRKTGLPIGGRNERIAAYGAISPKDPETIRATCAARLGLWLGLALPLTAQAQFNAGKVWTVVGGGAGWNARPYSWGGHAVRCLGYTPSCLYVATWGKVQKLSWAFLFAYCDECMGVIDSLDKRADVLDVDAVRAFLADKAVPV